MMNCSPMIFKVRSEFAATKSVTAS
jgi:hypothetical protein